MNWFKKQVKILRDKETLTDLGHSVKERCPRCKKGYILRNSFNSEWCSEDACAYFIHKGRVITTKIIDTLNDRFQFFTPYKKKDHLLPVTR